MSKLYRLILTAKLTLLDLEDQEDCERYFKLNNLILLMVQADEIEEHEVVFRGEPFTFFDDFKLYLLHYFEKKMSEIMN